MPPLTFPPPLSVLSQPVNAINATANHDVKALLVQPDNKFFVAGTQYGASGNFFSITKLKETGVIDSSFGRRGNVVTVFGGYSAFANAAKR